MPAAGPAAALLHQLISTEMRPSRSCLCQHQNDGMRLKAVTTEHCSMRAAQQGCNCKETFGIPSAAGRFFPVPFYIARLL
jgi:hypothetical protein